MQCSRVSNKFAYLLKLVRQELSQQARAKEFIQQEQEAVNSLKQKLFGNMEALRNLTLFASAIEAPRLRF